MSRNRCAAFGATLALAIASSTLAQGWDPFTHQHPQTQPQQTGQPAQSAPGALLYAGDPEITFTAFEHDFGSISDEKDVEYRFKFTNTGKGPLVLRQPTSSCGCTVPQLTKTEYLPGESGEITVIFKPSGKTGPQNRQVTLPTNDPKRQPSVQLNIKANVVPIVSVEPQFAILGQVPKNTGKTVTITVTGRSADFKVTEVTSSVPHVTAKVLEGKPGQVDGQPIVQVPVEVTLAADAPIAPVQTQLVIRTSEARKAVVQLPVTGEVMGDLQFTPGVLSFNLVTPGQPFSGELRLVNRTGKPFAVNETSFKAIGEPVELAAVPSKTGNGETYTIHFTGKAPERPGSYQGDVIIKTDVPGEETRTVRYFLRVRPAPGTPTPGQPGAAPGVTPGPRPTNTPSRPAAQPPAGPAPSSTPPSTPAPGSSPTPGTQPR